MGDHHYFTLLEQLHEVISPKAYLEIGTESGASLFLAKCFSVGVDPKFNILADVTTTKPALVLFQDTSDAFFASDFFKQLKPRFDFAFLDGMHLFEFLLRDFINAERAMNAGGVIALHDCVPFSHAGADRVWRKRVTKSWVGDVWKIVPVLRRLRPDLDIKVLNARPSGVVIVQNLDPQNDILSQHYDDLVSEWEKVDLLQYGLGRLSDDLDLREYTPESFRL